MTDQSECLQITVMRPKGQPIRPAYSYNVTKTLTLTGQCLARREDFTDEEWSEIVYLKECRILDVRPYVDPSSVEPDRAITEEADKIKAAVDAGEMSEPFPDTREVKPPPPLLKVHDPIKTEKPDWDQARKEMLEQLGRPEPRVHDAVTGKQTAGPEPVLCANPACTKGDDGAKLLSEKQIAQGNKYCCRDCFNEARTQGSSE